MATVAQSLASAYASWKAGDLATAEAYFRQALELGGETAELRYHLGTVLANQGKFAEAVANCQHTVKLNPELAEAHNLLGGVLGALGKLDEAAACCRRAVQLRPDLAEAHFNLGAVLARQGKYDEAMACYRQTLALKPQFAQAYSNAANAAIELGKIDEAASLSRRAIELQPNFAEAHSTLASALAEQGRLNEAAASCRRALELKPDLAEAHNNLGVVLERQGFLQEAAASCRRALQLKPDLAAAYNNLGAILDDSDQAIASCRKALELKPDFAGASRNLGALLATQGKLDEARECYSKALAIHPEQSVWRLRMASLCPTVFDSNDEISHYRAELLAELTDFAVQKPTLDEASPALSECRPSFNLQFHGRDDRPIREAYARIFRDRFARDGFAHDKALGSSGRRRIGFVVTDRHEKGFAKAMSGIVDRIDPKLFELVVIGSQRGMPLLRSAIANPFVQQLAIPERFEQAAAAIRSARFDLLYYWEVGTDNTNYFLPYLRLAPVQCTSWGIQVTSGIPQLDHYLSNAPAEPDHAQAHYTENLVLARTLLTYRPRVSLPGAPKSRESFGFSGGQHLYVCAQQLGKFQPDFDPILADILRRDAQGVVVIPEDSQGDVVGHRLRRRFAATMGDVANRIVFVPFQSATDYLSLIAAANVLLDPLYFGGVTTTYDGLSLDIPIVTLPGQFQRGRYTLACYKKMGVMDCVASDPSHYVDLAVALGTDAALRADIARKIRLASPVLFEDIEAVREHERIFGELIEQARSGHARGRRA